MINIRPSQGNFDRADMSDPMHGVTLQAIVERLVDHYGWKELGQRIRIRCFTSDPSVKSSLTFLRKTPWAKAKVESLYLYSLRKEQWAAEKKANRDKEAQSEE